MTNDAGKMIGEIIKGWNQKDWRILEAVHSEDWIDHTAPDGMNDLAAMKRFFELFTTSFPDMEMEVLRTIEKDGEVAYFYKISGTHEHNFLGFTANGQRVSFLGMMMLTIRDEKCAEAWGVTDKMTLFDQLRSST